MRLTHHIPRMAHVIYQHRILLFCLSLLVSLALGVGIKNLYIETSHEAYLVEDDSALLDYNVFRNEFGSDEFVYLLFHTDDFFTTDNLLWIKQLKEDLWKVPYVQDVVTVINAPYIESTAEGTIEIRDLLDKMPRTEEEMNAFRATSTGHSSYKNKLISEDGKFVGIMVETIVPEDDVKYEKNEVV